MIDPEYPNCTKHYDDDFLTLVKTTCDINNIMHQVRTLHQLICHLEDDLGEKSIDLERIRKIFGWKGET